MARYESTDPIERAHLKDAAGWTPPVHRYKPGPALSQLVRRYWIPIWSLPPGEVTVQRVLQYPVCQLVVGSDYARLVGVNTGMAKQELRGAGWVVGAMLQPATGWLLLRRPVTEVTDTFVDITALPGLDGPRLAADVRAVMAGNPSSVQNHQLAIDAFENALSGFQRRMPVDDEGILLNRIVALVEQDADVVRVSQLCDRFGLSERSLQRLTARRLGLTPKWLIQRRRLREAAGRLRRRAASVDLAMAATELGYADQAHFTRDFRTVTGITPGEFVAEPRPDPGTPIA